MEAGVNLLVDVSRVYRSFKNGQFSQMVNQINEAESKSDLFRAMFDMFVGFELRMADYAKIVEIYFNITEIME